MKTAIKKMISKAIEDIHLPTALISIFSMSIIALAISHLYETAEKAHKHEVKVVKAFRENQALRCENSVLITNKNGKIITSRGILLFVDSQGEKHQTDDCEIEKTTKEQNNG